MYALRAAVLAVVGVVALSATGVRIGNHAAYVRVVVDFNGRVPANQVVFDHLWTRTAALHVARPGITTSTSGGSGEGVRVALQPATQRSNIGISFAARRFKYVSYAVVSGNRLAIDLWKSAPPSAVSAPGFPRGCLSIRKLMITNGSDQRRAARSMGSSRTRSRSSSAARTARCSAGGPWSTAGLGAQRCTIAAAHRQAGTLEAVAFSAKDGALACIAQTRVTLRR